MFNLEQAIAAWRQRMLAAGITSPVPLEELEGHLREEIGHLRRSGVDEAKAFGLAVGKMGGMHDLKMEFSKAGSVRVERWKTYTAWAVWFGFVMPVMVYNLYQNEMSWGWRLAGWANIAAVMSALASVRWINSQFPVIRNRRLRWGIGFGAAMGGMAALVVFMNIVLPHFSVTMGPVAVLVLWALTFAAAGGALCAGLEEAANRTENSIKG